MSGRAFETVKAYLADIGVDVVEENAAEQMVVVRCESRGIHALVIDCEDDVVVLEQPILRLDPANAAAPRRLLEMNRDLVHGAFALDGGSGTLVFRDTLQLANLDLNELEASINALELALAQFGVELIGFAKAA